MRECIKEKAQTTPFQLSLFIRFSREVKVRILSHVGEVREEIEGMKEGRVSTVDLLN